MIMYLAFFKKEIIDELIYLILSRDSKLDTVSYLEEIKDKVQVRPKDHRSTR